MPFNCTILEVNTNLSRVDNLVDKAYNILNGELPDHGEIVIDFDKLSDAELIRRFRDKKD